MLKREGLRLPILLWIVCLLALLALGTFFDYPLAQKANSDGNVLFGRLVAAFGELPAFLAIASCGALMVRHRGKSTKFKDMFFLIGGIGLVIMSGLMELDEFLEDLPQVSFIDGFAVIFVLFLLNVVLTLWLTRDTSREDCLRFLMTAMLTCITVMIITNLIKIPWGRPRMQLLAQHPEVTFRPWYVFGNPEKRELIALGLEKDGFRSCPSGHAVTAACSVLWTLWATMHRFFEGKGRLLFLFSVLWTLFVALSRLALGFHFLSDVTISCLFAIVMYLISVFLFYRDTWLFRYFCKLMT